MPIGSVMPRMTPRFSCSWALAWPTVSQTPVTTSTVLSSSSSLTWGCSSSGSSPPWAAWTPSSTCWATERRSPVAWSTRATSHSTPRVDCRESAKSICIRVPDVGGHKYRPSLSAGPGRSGTGRSDRLDLDGHPALADARQDQGRLALGLLAGAGQQHLAQLLGGDVDPALLDVQH